MQTQFIGDLFQNKIMHKDDNKYVKKTENYHNMQRDMCTVCGAYGGGC